MNEINMKVADTALEAVHRAGVQFVLAARDNVKRSQNALDALTTGLLPSFTETTNLRPLEDQLRMAVDLALVAGVPAPLVALAARDDEEYFGARMDWHRAAEQAA